MKEFKQDFQLLKLLGEGSYAKVYECTREGQKFAVKVTEKSNKVAALVMRNGQKLLPLIKHPNILEYREDYEDDEYVGIILEFIDGIELFDYVEQNSQQIDGALIGLKEEYCCTIMRQLLSAVAYIHSLDISHNDIKLENILVLKGTFTDPKIKLIDFGLAQLGNESEIDTRGSDVYLSPECVMNLDRDLTKGDIWACGVILFALCTLRLPFDAFGSDKSNGSRSMLRRIAVGNFQYTELESSLLSVEIRDLIQQMLTRDPGSRKSADELLKHEFLQLKYSK